MSFRAFVYYTAKDCEKQGKYEQAANIYLAVTDIFETEDKIRRMRVSRVPYPPPHPRPRRAHAHTHHHHHHYLSQQRVVRAIAVGCDADTVLSIQSR